MKFGRLFAFAALVCLLASPVSAQYKRHSSTSSQPSSADVMASDRPQPVQGGAEPFKVNMSYNDAFEKIKDMMQRDNEFDSEDRDNGYIWTQIAKRNAIIQAFGRRVQVSIRKDGPNTSMVRVAAIDYKREKKFIERGDLPWEFKGVNEKDSQKYSEKLQEALSAATTSSSKQQ